MPIPENATEAANAREVAETSDITMLCMGTSDQVEGRMRGDDGVIAGLSDGEIVNFSNIARECAVSSHTTKSHFQILEDTLLGRWLPAYRRHALECGRLRPLCAVLPASADKAAGKQSAGEPARKMRPSFII